MRIRFTSAEARKLESGLRRRSRFNVALDPAGKQARTYLGIVYDSAAECRYAANLDLRLKIGDIQAWYRQIVFPLVVKPTGLVEGPAVQIGKMRIDFKIHHLDNSIELVEVKGVETEAWKLRKKLFNALYPNQRLTVIPAKEVKS